MNTTAFRRKFLASATAGLAITSLSLAAHAQFAPAQDQPDDPFGPPPQQPPADDFGPPPQQDQPPQDDPFGPPPQDGAPGQDDPFGPPPGDDGPPPQDGFGPPPADNGFEDPFAMPDPRDELADEPESVDADQYDVVIGTIDLNAVNVAYAEYETQRDLADGPGNNPFGGGFGDPLSTEIIDDDMLDEIQARATETAADYDVDVVTFDILQNDADNVGTVDLTRPVQESLLDDADEYAEQVQDAAPGPFGPQNGDDPFGPPPQDGAPPQDDPFGPPPQDGAPPQDDPFGPPQDDAPQDDDPFGPPPAF